jgi:thiol-disulfide isomerase/thioredoxin
MKKKVLMLWAFYALFCSVSAFSQCTVQVKGFVKFISDDFKVTAYQRDGFNKNILSEVNVGADHTYQMNITTKKPGTVVIDCGKWQDVQVWVEDENMEIDFRGRDTARVKIKNPPYVYIKAGKKNEIMNMINYEIYRDYQNMIAISQAVYHSPITDAKEKQAFSFKLYDMNENNFKAHMRYLCEHYADRTSVLAAVRYLKPQTDSTLIDKTLASIEANNPGTTLVSDYKEQARITKEREERMKVGNPAPDFSFPDAKGKMHSLKSFKGKVVVVDFWASWCGPCRQEIPNLKNYYNELKGNKKVAFMSVSIDAKRPDWDKAVKEENMPWLQLLAPNGGKEIMESYQFSGIPFILVIDQEGKIYKKNLRDEAIKEAINDALSGKKAGAPKASVGMSMGASM